MKFKVLREALLRPLKAVAGAVEKRAAQIPVLANVLIKVHDNVFSLVTTDQEIELVSQGVLLESTSPLNITVPFRKLMDIARALPDQSPIDVTAEDTRVVIRSNRSRFSLSTLPPEQFPDVKEAPSDIHIKLDKKIFRGLMEQCAFAMAEQDVRYFLNGMLLEVKGQKLYAVAADGHRLAVSSLIYEGEAQPIRVIVPRKGISELMRLLDGEGLCDLWIGTHVIRVATDEVTLTSRLLEGKFPPYEQLIPRLGDRVVLGSREALKETLQRASVLFTDKSRAIRLRLTTNSLKILAINSEQDEVEEYLEVQYEGPDLEIGFNVKYLLDFLTIIHDDQVKFTFTDANSSVLVEGASNGEGLYVIMPMRI